MPPSSLDDLATVYLGIQMRNLADPLRLAEIALLREEKDRPPLDPDALREVAIPISSSPDEDSKPIRCRQIMGLFARLPFGDTPQPPSERVQKAKG